MAEGPTPFVPMEGSVTPCSLDMPSRPPDNRTAHEVNGRLHYSKTQPPRASHFGTDGGSCDPGSLC